ncbi:MAG: hypothetical protein IJ586_00025 [Alloprevotella sp.]|nr:hypothetical protein [Alloprevotella sp.]
MAYNPSIYSPYGWGQQITAPQPINGLVSVTGMEGARAYQLPPNSSMPLFDANEDIMYVKTTDGAGFPTVKAYRFALLEQQEAQNAEYVSRAEFEALVAKIEELKEVRHAEQPVPEPEPGQLDSSRAKRGK